MDFDIVSFVNALPGACSVGILWGLMTLGVYLTFRVLNIADMTCDGSFVLGSAVCAVMITSGYGPGISLLAAFGTGMIAGFITGFLHTKLKMHELLAGILTMTALFSINLRIMGKPNVSLASTYMNKDHTLITNLQAAASNYFDLTLSINAATLIIGGLLCVLIVLVLYLFLGTEIGSSIRATGSNPKMVRAMGVDTDKMIILGLMISNGVIALSGAFVSQYQRFADINGGTGTLVQGLASIVIGEALFGWFAKRLSFWFTLASVILGTVVYRIVIAVVLQLGLPSGDMKMLTSMIITIALAVPIIKGLIRNYAARYRANGGLN